MDRFVSHVDDTGPIITMDDAAVTTVVYSGTTGITLADRRLFVHDIATDRNWQLGPNDRASYSPTLSDDGQWILYITEINETPELMLSRRDGTDWKLLTGDASGLARCSVRRCKRGLGDDKDGGCLGSQPIRSISAKFWHRPS